MRFTSRHSGSLIARALPLLLAASGCSRGNRLEQYSFANRSMATVVIAPQAPLLLTPDYSLKGADDLLLAVVREGGKAARDVEGQHARARLDSAASGVVVADDLARQTLERTSRYLGLRPVQAAADADFLLEVHMRNYGVDARSASAAYLFTNAEAVLLDRRTGREIWNSVVHGSDRLTPRVRGTGSFPGAGVITAGTLHLVSVADFHDALNQLVTLSANRIADELRSSLREVRQE